MRQYNWGIERAGDAVTAKLALVEHNYSAVLLDLGLPKGGGPGRTEFSLRLEVAEV